YWFEKARKLVEIDKVCRFGLVATKSIAKGASNVVLHRIVHSDYAVITEAWTNEPWIVDGAAVRVAIVCVSHAHKDSGERYLNGVAIDAIGPDLSPPVQTAGAFFASAR